MYRSFLLLFMALLVGPSVLAQVSPQVNNRGGLEISIAGDLVGRFGLTDDSLAEDELTPRTAEFLFYAPVDPVWDALASAAVHKHAGEDSYFELHELYIGSSKLIPRSRFRAGQFFLGVGRLNRFHQHDWPFVTAPKVHKEFFGQEAMIDTGLEFSTLLPTSRYWDLTIGVTSGNSVHAHEHAHEEEEEEHGAESAVIPTHYARLATFTELGSAGLEIGFNLLRQKTHEREEILLAGLDLTSKWRELGYLKYLLQSEVWFKDSAIDDGEEQELIGFYIFNEYFWSRRWSMGLRLDGFSALSLKENGESVNNMTWAAVPQVSYRTSEFSTLRLAYSEIHRDERIMEEDEARTERIVELQLVFVLGSHPSHDF